MKKRHPPNPFSLTPEESPGLLLWKATTLWRRRIAAALEAVGLNHASFVMLATLAWAEGAGLEPTQSTIVRMTKLDKMTVSKGVRSLEEEELVARKPHPADERAKRVELTEQGRALIRDAVPLVETADKAFFGRLNRSEREQLLTLLSKLGESDE